MVAAITAVLAGIVGAPAAHADEAGFYDCLDTHGFNYSAPSGSLGRTQRRQSRLRVHAVRGGTMDRFRAETFPLPQFYLIEEAVRAELYPDAR
ncbi:hypothetical protein [Mycobacterium sp. 1274756.6]|uniref:hypothetical protein n=1 Tax=Mycobacterium sp. 1274756.6 TaxID=1834076 RepID=UPI000830050E|nr:hypothetical protein [Mycobacterium sp. 1274756.6]